MINQKDATHCVFIKKNLKRKVKNYNYYLRIQEPEDKIVSSIEYMVKKGKTEQELKFKSRGVLLYALNNLYKTVVQESRLSTGR